MSSWGSIAFVSRQPRVIALAAFVLSLGAIWSWPRDAVRFSLPSGSRLCTDDSWSAGRWIPRSPPPSHEITSVDQALVVVGFEGCASHLDLEWGMGLLPAGRVPRRAAMSWTWEPACSLRSFDRPMLVRTLVQDGGLLIVGDSTSEQLFLALSCFLYPDVVSIVDEADSDDSNRQPDGNPRRRWRQHLHLTPSARAGYSLASDRPLVSFVRTDLLYSRTEIAAMLDRTDLVTHENTTRLYDETFERHAALVRDAALRYGSIVVSTGGHWTDKAFTVPTDELADVFEAVLRQWIIDIGAILRSDQRVYIRSYLPGHADFAAALQEQRPPLSDPAPVDNKFNWPLIPRFNDIARSLVTRAQSPSFTYLGLDRPSRMRPDGHAYDGLHWALGADVIESQIRFLYDLLTRPSM